MWWHYDEWQRVPPPPPRALWPVSDPALSISPQMNHPVDNNATLVSVCIGPGNPVNHLFDLALEMGLRGSVLSELPMWVWGCLRAAFLLTRRPRCGERWSMGFQKGNGMPVSLRFGWQADISSIGCFSLRGSRNALLLWSCTDVLNKFKKIYSRMTTVGMFHLER